MKFKIDKKRLEEISEKVFNTYYNIDNISAANLDRYITYFTDGDIRLQVRTHNDRKYLGYIKQDRDQILSMLPVSNYMFDKLIQKWFSKKYNISIDSVLKPLWQSRRD
jgi:uncharacterized protein (UPF0297 family)